jgi:hypothetical protein
MRSVFIYMKVLSTQMDFETDSFDTDVAANTEARLGIFYVDLGYDNTSHIVDSIKEIPTVDAKLLSDCIDCLEKIVNNWN